MTIVTPLNRQRRIAGDDLLITMADTQGIITYANDAFCRTHACHEHDVLRHPHDILRHPDMPAVIFELVWQRLNAGREVFGYLKNLARNGDYYWTLAHWTVNADRSGRAAGYQCCRRAASPESIAAIEPIYREMRRIETSAATPQDGLVRSRQILDQMLASRGQGYDQFVLSLAMMDEPAACRAA
ncbi:MAG: PAS domain-containing protein [Ferrovibrio sp.]|uniref:PAS domain-containing protein n=1 Tax=Ferrovibrio sp. TaxID=1917215 RepID=UPI0026323CDF|nr:PAS domain-containing protein [Ferrovibrio sp.]MCW0235951.1 PAS domain-containing protein [Ferrovibrio sp.]